MIYQAIKNLSASNLKNLFAVKVLRVQMKMTANMGAMKVPHNKEEIILALDLIIGENPPWNLIWSKRIWKKEGNLDFL